MSRYFLRRYEGDSRSLGKVLTAVYPELPFSLLERLMRTRDVFVNGERARQDHVVQSGDMLDLYCAPTLIKLREVYRDGNLLVLAKPRGVATDGQYSFASLVGYVYGDKVTPLHRLDTNTDGLLMFACNAEAYACLYQAMQAHRITKYYTALVCGVVDAPLHLDGYLLKDAAKGRVKIVHRAQGDAAAVACDVTPIETRDGITLVRVMLKGGKTHQLRAQLADCGHFILGDGKYGDDRVNRARGYRRQQLTADALVLPEDIMLSNLGGLRIDLPEQYISIRF
jgi:23S rRNA pseudouridine955/2504/2580 synthase